jgi:CheY-like chemotaxis protein
MDLLAPRAAERGLELVRDLRPDVPTWIHGDPGRLRQVLLNLGGNAIKFTESGQVALIVELEEDSAHDVVLLFSVRDTGIGVRADRQEAIFESFTQADGGTTRQYGGTGLGLGISRRIVELMGGSIWVRSEFNEGSTFRFRVKLTHAEAVSFETMPTRMTVSSTTEESPSLEARVLLVEDHPVNAMLAGKLLENLYCDVTLAQNGQEALDLIEETSFDLVLMDVQMPVMDGLEASRRIRELEHGTGAHVPIAAITAHAMRGDRARCLEAGMDDYITKPIKADEIRRVVEKYVGLLEVDMQPPQTLTKAIRRPRRAA